MKKLSLQNVKKENRRLIINTLMEGQYLSRIELARKTELSPSTVSGIVSELLEQAIFIEAGEAASTGGRKRTVLSLNGRYASVAVAEITRSEAVLRIYDMHLKEQHRIRLSGHYIAGDDLFECLTEAVSQIGNKYKGCGKLAGIGLQFQEDMSETEFSVMYSTSLSSDAISLKDALISRFHVPVIEDYSQNYSITTILSAEKNAGNTAFVNIGKKIIASVALNGVPLVLKDGRTSVNITPLLPSEVIPQLVYCPEGQGASRKASGADKKILSALASSIVQVLKPLCVFFQLDRIYFNGAVSSAPGFIKETEKILCKQLKGQGIPKIFNAEINTEHQAAG
ncbi:winged helix-turn-helix domain-containing protein, partial [Treponema sp. OttesenSCG-928-L16]|nr:winged helix-turn-helix domain-containing protein [Treponema sp. OttesenSCG-928-L16]